MKRWWVLAIRAAVRRNSITASTSVEQNLNRAMISAALPQVLGHAAVARCRQAVTSEGVMDRTCLTCGLTQPCFGVNPCEPL